MADNPQKDLIKKRWDRQYRIGKYQSQGPIEFVHTIMNNLKKYKMLQSQGLYIGCGNGRNYIPLIKHGLNLDGLDVSPVAIKMTKQKLDSINRDARLTCCDVLQYATRRRQRQPYDYAISIQAFQHGTLNTIKKYFAKTYDLLRHHGLLFLRVNSASTQIFHNHRTTEKNQHGGFTILYTDGPKKDMQIHFFTDEELLHLTRQKFSIMQTNEKKMKRSHPKTGCWSQFEMILQKTATL